jgi:hypothetical protein
VGRVARMVRSLNRGSPQERKFRQIDPFPPAGLVGCTRISILNADPTRPQTRLVSLCVWSTFWSTFECAVRDATSPGFYTACGKFGTAVDPPPSGAAAGKAEHSTCNKTGQAPPDLRATLWRVAPCPWSARAASRSS